MLEESDISIQNAYQEGYKQATVELSPEVDYWKYLYENNQKNNRKNNIKNYFYGLGSGVIIGGCTFGILSLKVLIKD